MVRREAQYHDHGWENGSKIGRDLLHPPGSVVEIAGLITLKGGCCVSEGRDDRAEHNAKQIEASTPRVAHPDCPHPGQHAYYTDQIKAQRQRIAQNAKESLMGNVEVKELATF